MPTTNARPTVLSLDYSPELLAFSVWLTKQQASRRPAVYNALLDGPLSPELLAFSTWWATNSGDNCGIGPGGFQPGNTCAKGGSGGGGFLSRLFGKKDTAPKEYAPPTTTTEHLEERMKNSQEYQETAKKIEERDAHVWAGLAEKHGMTVPDFKAHASQKAQELVDSMHPYTRTSEHVLGLILAEGGRFKNQHEPGTSPRGTNDPKLRAKIENKIMATGPNTAPEHRPLSGYLSTPNYGRKTDDEQMDRYGHVKILLKPSVRDRSTVVSGDALEMGTNNYGVATPLNKVGHHSLIPQDLAYHGMKMLDSEKNYHAAKHFAEINIHGGVKAHEIERVELPTAPSADLRGKLTAHGIPWHIRGEK